MKKISEHLGEVIVAIACAAMLISIVAVYRVPVGDFFAGLTTNIGSVSGSVLDAFDNGEGGESGGEGGGSVSGGGSQDVVTDYTQEEIDNSNGLLVPIGRTDPYYVVAAFSDDFSEVTITKNGEDSDGFMMDWESSTQSSNPMYTKSDTLKSAVVGIGVKNLGHKAFYNCTSLTNISISDSVTSIGERSFDSCTSLTSITLPDSVTFIDDSVFSDCTSLKSATLPDGITSILDQLFWGCESLESITIPDSVTSICPAAFRGCESLESIIIPDSVTSIHSSAFSGCSSLESIIIPNSVTSFEGTYTFYNCTSLKSITLPDGITSIGDYTFRNCTSLENITFNGTKEEWGIITLGTCWNSGVPATEVTCTDGTVEI